MARYEIKRRRVSRARETAAPYGVKQPAAADAPPVGFKVTVAERGRIVLPAEVRERLQIEDGDWLTLILEPDGVIKLLTGRAWTDQFVKVMQRAARHIPPSRRLSDELIAERRREAAKEERGFRRAGAAVRKQKRR